MKILLHMCCAPCATFPVFLLRAEGYEVDGLFLNPNIDPQEETARRWAACVDFGEAEEFRVRKVDAPHDSWLSAVCRDLTKPARCRACYAHRLLPAARLAAEEGYDAFTTSLLVSVYQDHEGVAAACREASSEAGIPFLYRDFRVGYRRSREMARGRHLYMQKYCGCEFSASETGR